MSELETSKLSITENITVQRFNKAHAKNIEAAKKIAETYASSSEDEEEDLDEKSILESLYKNYNSSLSDSHVLSKTTTFLENALHSGAATCLICIESIRRADAIWSCKDCYCFFHLNCIRRWANDSVAQIKIQNHLIQTNDTGYYNNLGVYVPPKRSHSLVWCCPQCRKEYEPGSRPSTYECFCGKEVNPQPQLWLIPHSCGEICGKQLQPQCGHKCLLLCHPGPCPPCAQYATTSCVCGKSPMKTLRCNERTWKCLKKCTELLLCGQHLCNQLCHKSGQCPPCSNTCMQACICGSEIKKRNCINLKWQCQKICGKTYSCGIHKCKNVCHVDSCGECPLGQPRSCPCGKSKKVGPCTEIIETCGDTCQKSLSCKLHTCNQRCHRGECNLCIIIIKKKCRCGMREKELPCSKEFTCDTKCKQIRDCGKHPCSKKCCDGRCPPCDKICAKPLSCKKHKCQSVCHEGPCYPCKQQSQVNCRCGKTSKNVPCGRKRTVRIVCPEICRIPAKCHHQTTHRCHKNDCPPCQQICNLRNDTTHCEHKCEAKCHAAIRVSNKSVPNTVGVWQSPKQIIFKSNPHPPCEKKIIVICIGGHEAREWPCWNSKPVSCQRLCNRLLSCGNHKCSMVCHTVDDKNNMQQQPGCQSCKKGCSIPRIKGCIHSCTDPCHLPTCSPCQANIKRKCHCGLSNVIYKCSEFYNEDAMEKQSLRREQLNSCGSRCIKNYSCGHRCTSVCHSGQCPNSELCKKKVRILCDCKHLKIDVSCDKHRAGLISIPCGQSCENTRSQLEQLKKQQSEHLRLKEEEKNRLELEKFEKKFNKKGKHRERKLPAEITKRSINWKPILISMGAIAAILVAIIVAFYEE